MGLHLNGRMTDQLDTVCSICRCGIFSGKPRVWSREPFSLGLVHPECLTPAQPRGGRDV